MNKKVEEANKVKEKEEVMSSKDLTIFITILCAILIFRSCFIAK